VSFEDGWAAIHLEMPRRVPRTEYSAAEHWPLVSAVTGIQVGPESDEQIRRQASRQFMRAWNYDLCWSTLIGAQEFGELRTRMGHAEYAAGGGDYSAQVLCPFTDPEQVLRFDPWQAYGHRDRGALVERFEDAYRRACRNRPAMVNMTGIYVTLISGLIEIFGWEMLLLAAGTDPRRFGEMADRYASWVRQYFDALAQADVPVVMVHDDLVWTQGAIFHPDWYRRYVFPNYQRLLSPLVQAGKRILFTADGNYTAFIDDIVACGAHGLFMEPTTDLSYAAARYGRTHVLVGNVDTRVLLRGDKPQIRAEVQRCMAVGKDCPGFFLAVGNHIPSNTPVESALYYNQVYEELGRR